MGEAAPRAAEGTYSGDIDQALGLLQLLYGDEYTFGYGPQHGFWVIKDGHIGSLLIAGSAEELGRQLEETEGAGR